MQHSIEPTQHGPRGEAMASAVQSCVHCGFCLPVCPTYQLLGEEMDSPRGRIYLMKNVLEGNLSTTEAEPYIDRCLGCLACMPACPSGVAYNDLLMSYRALIEPTRIRPPIDNVVRKLVIETLPYPDKFRKAVISGRFGKLFKGILPAKIKAMLRLLPATLPQTEPLPEIYPAQGLKRARVALLNGCVQSVLNPEINWATIRVLSANGVETIIPKTQSCCGSILMHIGEDNQAQQLARNNLHCFPTPTEVDAIITTAAGCGSGMHEYGLLFKNSPHEQRAIEFANQVQDITVFLDTLGLKTPPSLPSPLKVVYHDACHLFHAQGIEKAPRNLLNQIGNLTLFELHDGNLCCGSAGTYNLDQPKLARDLGERKATHILSTPAEAVVTGNIGCMMQIQAHLKKQSRPLHLYHTVQVLDMAYQG